MQLKIMNIAYEIYACPGNEVWVRVQKHLIKEIYDSYDLNIVNSVITIEQAIEASGIRSDFNSGLRQKVNRYSFNPDL